MKKYDRRPAPRDLHEPVQAKHLEVRIHDQSDLERMIRKFTKKVRLDGILQDYIDKSRFVKPSEARRAKKIKARKLRDSE